MVRFNIAALMAFHPRLSALVSDPPNPEIRLFAPHSLTVLPPFAFPTSNQLKYHPNPQQGDVQVGGEDERVMAQPVLAAQPHQQPGRQSAPGAYRALKD
jgi:hypothetical protein